MMSSASIAQLLPLFVLGFLFVPPYWKIFQRSGWHPALSFLMIVPLVNIILLWVVAFKKWPSDDYMAGTFE